jgi:hypothetical protein
VARIKRNILILIVTFLFNNINAQGRKWKDWSFIGVDIDGTYFYGHPNVSFKINCFWSGKIFFGGFNLGGSFSSKTNRQFHPYDTINPRIGMGMGGIILGIKLVDKNRFKLIFTENNSFTAIDLCDANHYVHSRGSIFDNPKTVRENIYFSLQPGLIAIIPLSKKSRSYLSINPYYNFRFGQSDFGNKSDFQTFSLAIGVGGLF